MKASAPIRDGATGSGQMSLPSEQAASGDGTHISVVASQPRSQLLPLLTELFKLMTLGCGILRCGEGVEGCPAYARRQPRSYCHSSTID